MFIFDFADFLGPEKPTAEKLPVAKLERRQFAYTRQQWTGKSPKQFLIDWTRKNLAKTATLSFERVEAGGGWWRARCIADWSIFGSVFISDQMTLISPHSN